MFAAVSKAGPNIESTSTDRRARRRYSVDDGRQRQVVEDFSAVKPHSDKAVLAETLVVEPG